MQDGPTGEMAASTTKARNVMQWLQRKSTTKGWQERGTLFTGVSLVDIFFEMDLIERLKGSTITVEERRLGMRNWNITDSLTLCHATSPLPCTRLERRASGAWPIAILTLT
ncbi:hypothetical protein BDR05DRAFT_947962 [Suillus weaverae]|nr:hypothetical protein BDR05DRAFT_947962 [Suillus weaverae]